MAIITGFNVTINKMCRADKTSCQLAYTYNVLWNDSDGSEEGGEYTVKALLWGGSGYTNNRMFVDSTDDAHKINQSTPMPVVRLIDVRCDLLDHFWGDNITIKLSIAPDSAENVTFEAVSTTEMEHGMMATPQMEEAA